MNRDYTDFIVNKCAEKGKNITNAAMGIAGEAGEIVDIVKKHLFQGHDLDENKLVEELGDLMFYITLMCHCINTPIAYVEYINRKKLNKRYPEGFSEDRSVNRKE